MFSSAVGRAPVNVLQQYSRFIKQRVFLGPNKRTIQKFEDWKTHFSLNLTNIFTNIFTCDVQLQPPKPQIVQQLHKCQVLSFFCAPPPFSFLTFTNQTKHFSDHLIHPVVFQTISTIFIKKKIFSSFTNFSIFCSTEF